jgi:hypothetical protein
MKNDYETRVPGECDWLRPSRKHAAIKDRGRMSGPA